MNATEKARRLVEQGNALMVSGRNQAALAKMEEALRLLPDHPGVVNNIGVVLEKLGRLEEALARYEQVRRSTPPHPGLLNNCAIVLRKLGRGAEALERFDQALALKPDYAEALTSRGRLLVEQLARAADGLQSLNRSLQLRPAHADTLYFRGRALQALDRFADALASFDGALAVQPRHAEALEFRALTLERLKRYAEAAETWEQLLTVAPEHPYVRGRLLHDRLQGCDWRDYEAQVKRLEAAIARGEKQEEPWPMLAYCRSPELLLQCAETLVGDRHPPKATSLAGPAPYAHRRIRVAWQAGGFGASVETQTLIDMLEQQDRTRFETFGVSVGPSESGATRRRVEAAFEYFVDARSWSDEQTAQWLRDREIDILVIVAAFMSDSRLGIPARRAAPVQVNFGFQGSIGASYVDYFIADRHMVHDEDDRFFIERIVRLPGALMAYYAPPEIYSATPSRAALGLPRDGFVFCCFNTSYKIQPETFDVWMRLLRDHAGSVLWLREASATAKANLQREAAARGISADRLIFAPFAATYDEYLVRFRAADLFLDAAPYNAHTTACESLWAGLPLVTCRSGTAWSRVAGGLLHAAGLSDLVADDLPGYEAIVRALVASPKRLADSRSRLAAVRTDGALFDPAGFCRHLEAAFTTMYDRHRRGEAPAAFDVD